MLYESGLREWKQHIQLGKESETLADERKRHDLTERQSLALTSRADLGECFRIQC
jgi:hypothetical protein